MLCFKQGKLLIVILFTAVISYGLFKGTDLLFGSLLLKEYKYGTISKYQPYHIGERFSKKTIRHMDYNSCKETPDYINDNSDPFVMNTNIIVQCGGFNKDDNIVNYFYINHSNRIFYEYYNNEKMSEKEFHELLLNKIKDAYGNPYFVEHSIDRNNQLNIKAYYSKNHIGMDINIKNYDYEDKDKRQYTVTMSVSHKSIKKKAVHFGPDAKYHLEMDYIKNRRK
jgi:hypothetical protein